LNSVKTTYQIAGALAAVLVCDSMQYYLQEDCMSVEPAVAGWVY